MRPLTSSGSGPANPTAGRVLKEAGIEPTLDRFTVDSLAGWLLLQRKARRRGAIEEWGRRGSNPEKQIKSLPFCQLNYAPAAQKFRELKWTGCEDSNLDYMLPRQAY